MPFKGSCRPVGGPLTGGPLALAAPLPVGSVVLANSRDRGAWYKGRVLRADTVDGDEVLYTVQYEAHRILRSSPHHPGALDDTESGIPESHVCAVAEARPGGGGSAPDTSAPAKAAVAKAPAPA